MADFVQGELRRPIYALGFRRIECVRLIVDEDGTTAEVTGVTHRLPRTIRVPLRTAAALIEAGVPKRVEARREAHSQHGHVAEQRKVG
jgi:hypothetical protein